MTLTSGTSVNAAASAPVALARDARWWPGVAQAVLDAAGPGAAPPLPCDLHRVTVIVPRLAHAPLLHAALHAALGGRACIAPRIATLESWGGRPDDPPAAAQGALAQVALFEALRANAWVQAHFGAHAAGLWVLARDIAVLGDELTLAACGAPDAFTGRWRAAVQRHFSQRAAAAGEPQAQLVLALWRAGAADGAGAGRLRERLAGLARAADGPLLWLVPQGAAGWQQNYCQRYAELSGHPARLVVGDAAALAAARPWLAAAWPEFAPAPAAPAPLAQRAAALAQALDAGAPSSWPALRIWRCNALEEEASVAAGWTLDCLAAGAGSVALVALDRLAARRVRALLERAGVAVADEAGWKLSTTSAAAALMRWLDVVTGDFAAADLLDWLRSPFALGADVTKAASADCIAAALRQRQVGGGAAAVRAAVAQAAPAAGAVPALQLIDRLIGAARPWGRPGSLGRYLGLLDATLDQLDMRAPLAADPVGAAVLEAVGTLQEQLAGARLPVELHEFRAFLAGHFEILGAGGDAPAGPVVMTTLAGTRLRRFDAALLIGAGAEHLPGQRAGGGLLAGVVRQELGLPTASDREREAMADLAALMANSVQLAATWRQRAGDEPRPLAPLFDRLGLVVRLAGGPVLVGTVPEALRTVPPAMADIAAPRAAGGLPQRISASAYQDLVDCPFRFYALRVLGLRERDALRARPDKRDLGLALHQVLYEFHRAHPDAGAEPQRDAPALLVVIDAVLEPLMRQRPAFIAYRQRLRQLVPGYLAWLAADVAAGWRWHDGERALARPFPAAAAPAGSAPQLHGRLDRIDVNADGRRRILDFKARDAATLRRTQRDPGEAIQLLFYGLLLEPAADQAAYLSLQAPRDPRDPEQGVATPVAAPEPFGDNVAALAARMARDLARVDGGSALTANGAEAVCRRCELRSLCRHGYVPPLPEDAEALDE